MSLILMETNNGWFLELHKKIHTFQKFFSQFTQIAQMKL